MSEVFARDTWQVSQTLSLPITWVVGEPALVPVAFKRG